MTRKDFQVIANILAEIEHNESLNLNGNVILTDNIREMVDDYLHSTNANYSSSKFWQAVDKRVSDLQ